MAANNIGVPKRIPAPNTIERVGIGDGGSDPSAPKPKQAPPAFTFGGAGSGTAFQKDANNTILGPRTEAGSSAAIPGRAEAFFSVLTHSAFWGNCARRDDRTERRGCLIQL